MWRWKREGSLQRAEHYDSKGYSHSRPLALKHQSCWFLGAFAPIPKGSNMNSPACNAGKPMKPLPKPEGLEFDLFQTDDSRNLHALAGSGKTT
jgi:hypothetical protein